MPIFKRYCKRCGKLFKTREEFRTLCDAHGNEATPDRATLPAVGFPKDDAKGVGGAKPLPPVPFPSEAPCTPSKPSLPAVPFPDETGASRVESDVPAVVVETDMETVEDDGQQSAVDVNHSRNTRSVFDGLPKVTVDVNHPDNTRKVFDPKKWKPTPAALALLRRAGCTTPAFSSAVSTAPQCGHQDSLPKKRLFEGKYRSEAEIARIKYDRENPVAYCKQCGRQFRLEGKDDKREFCSNQCAKSYEEAKKRERRERMEAEERDRKWREEEEIAKHGIPCPICGRKFLRKKQRGRKQLYCSTKCAVTASYRRTHHVKDPKDHPTDLAHVEKVMQLPLGERWKYAKNFNAEEERYARQLAVKGGFLESSMCGKRHVYPSA